MRLRYDVEGKYQDITRFSVLDDLERKFKRAKKESLREFFERVKEQAIENIYDNNEETGVPLSGRLEHSIDYSTSGSGGSSGRISAGNSETPYAALHDLQPGQRDFANLILPNGRFLKFFNHRTEVWNRKTYVFRPGIAFMTRAWNDKLGELPDIIEEKIEEEYT